MSDLFADDKQEKLFSGKEQIHTRTYDAFSQISAVFDKQT
jgi:hypothetical protein